MPCSQKKKQKRKQKQYCNKFNRDFKNGPHQKKIFKETIKNLKNKIMAIKARICLSKIMNCYAKMKPQK